MQSIQIDGTYTYADSVKTLKIGEPIKLMKNRGLNHKLNLFYSAPLAVWAVALSLNFDEKSVKRR